ncbi:MAG: TrbI/VirB10 family protein [Vibrio gallaecicus]
MSNALDPSVLPSELNDQPRARRLSKLPAIIIMGVATLVVCLLGYSILTRGQPKEVVVEDDENSEEIETTLFSANDIIQGQDKSVFERPILPEKEETPAKDSKPEMPELAPKIIEKIPVRSNAPSRPNAPGVVTMSQEETFADKVARAKEQLLLDALGARTLAASAPDVEEGDTVTNAVSAPVASFGGRDRGREQREIREKLAVQTSPDLERIASLLSTIAENTSQQNKPATPYQGGLSSTSQGVASQGVATNVKRLSGMEALASLSQGRAAVTNPVNRGLTLNNGLYQGGLASLSQGRPINNIYQRPLVNNRGLALNNGLFQGGLASRPASNNSLSSNPNRSSVTRPQSIGIGRLSQAQKDLLTLAENSPAGTFIQAKRDYGYSTEVAREQLTDTDLRVGTIIPAILINGINSELEGVAIAQVSQNVWDSTHGENVLIPQGTRLIGDFKSDVKEGQSRVGVSWNRLQFPDGKTLALSNMVGSDQAGFTGFSDMVNNHYKKKFGSATLLSIISGLGSMFASDNEKQTSGESFTNQLAQQYGTVGSSMIEKNLEIPPTIIIRPGYRFNVIVTQDFALKPYYE